MIYITVMSVHKISKLSAVPCAHFKLKMERALIIFVNYSGERRRMEMRQNTHLSFIMYRPVGLQYS